MKYLLLLTAGMLLYAISYSQGCSTNYVEPNFQLQKTDPGCTPNTGSITAVNIQNGVAPFTFTLVETNTTNSTGSFTGLGPGLYTIELRDACGTVRTRQATLVPWSFSFQFTIDRISDCSDGQVNFTTTPQNAMFEYGIVRNGDTTWSSSAAMDIKVFKRLTILVRDACGNIQSQTWNAPDGFVPYIDALQYRLQCDKFDLFPVYYGFNDAEVCLYEYGSNKLVECKQAKGNYTGGHETNFFDIPWGEYYVIVTDKCYRDSAFHPDMRSAGGSELNPYNWDCNTFTMHVDGMEDTVCLYDGYTDKLISCKGQDTVSINPRTGVPWPSGAVWEDLPYGHYYAWIYDPCDDSIYRIDSIVTAPFENYIASVPGCSLNETTVLVNFDPGSKSPYTVNVYNQNGSLNSSFISNVTNNYFGVNVDSTSGNLTVVGHDACGNADTAIIAPQVTRLFKNVTVYNKCPGVSGTGGSGDIKIMATTHSAVGPRPQIIKRNGADMTVNYSYHANDTFLFPNLEPGIYVVKYSFTNCSQMVFYDTLTVNDYIYPTQHADTAIQCGGNMFTFTFPIIGGLSPYTFQIIGNTPIWPSLVAPPQSSPVFTIGNGQHYTNVTVRAIDRCGNSTIADVAVEPINGCSTLPVDSVDKNPAEKRDLVARVFPNPSHSQFTISISQKKRSNYKIQIINAAGVQLYERMLYNIDKKEVNVDQRFVPGLYVVNVTDISSGKSSIFKQVVK